MKPRCGPSFETRLKPLLRMRENAVTFDDVRKISLTVSHPASR
jgi:hypothetical protein